jgi:hypothetical protein
VTISYISNSFSLGMVSREHLCLLKFEPVEGPDPKVAYRSIVGHADTAALLNVKFNRESVVLNPGDELLVAQLQGGRLPEGCTTLPDGVKFAWIRVTL